MLLRFLAAAAVGAFLFFMVVPILPFDSFERDAVFLVAQLLVCTGIVGAGWNLVLPMLFGTSQDDADRSKGG